MTSTLLQLDANLAWLFTEKPFPARFAAAAAAGFTAVEFPSPYPHDVAHLRALLDDHGLASVLINTPAGEAGGPQEYGVACHPGGQGAFRAQIDVALNHADALGTGAIHVLGGTVPPGVSAAEALETYKANIAWAAEQVTGTRVVLLLEVLNQYDVPGFILDSLGTAAEVVRAVGSDAVRLLFDVYHCQMSQGAVTKHLHELMPLIGHVQIADVPLRAEPGTGELNWDYVFGQLRIAGYANWVGCEYQPGAGTVAGLDWRFLHGRHLAVPGLGPN